MSCVIHFGGAALLGAFARTHHLIAGDPEPVSVQTTIIALQHREAPKPSPEPRPHRNPVVHASAAHPQTRVEPPSSHAHPPRELAKIVAYAPPAPPKHHPVEHVTTTSSIESDERNFARTLTKLRSENNPIESQQRMAVSAPSGKRYAADFSSVPEASHGGEGYLAPVKSWRDGPYTYYYLRYDVVYPDGSRETGYVPWPVRYLPGQDPFGRGSGEYHIPLPLPLPDFVLSSDTNVKPLIAFCLQHRSQFPSCPIMHD